MSNFFFAYLSIFLYFWEKIKRYHFSYFEYLSKNSPKLNQNYYWLWVYFGISVSNGQIRITVLNYTVPKMQLLLRGITSKNRMQVQKTGPAERHRSRSTSGKRLTFLQRLKEHIQSGTSNSNTWATTQRDLGKNLRISYIRGKMQIWGYQQKNSVRPHSRQILAQDIDT